MKIHIKIVEAGRPVHGSLEDIQSTERVKQLYLALDRIGHSILPGITAS